MKRRRTRRIAALLVGCAAALATAASAALPDVITPGGTLDVRCTFSTAFIVAQDGWEHLILETGYVTGQRGSGPPRLAFVVALPHPPRYYAVVADTPMVETWNVLARVAHFAPSPGMRNPPESDEEYRAVRLAPAPQTGRYELAVVPPPEGADGVQRWLERNGFGGLPEATVRAYADAGWAFMTVLIRPDEGAATLPPTGQLRPIEVSFRSDRIVYPLRLGAGDGSFHSYAFLFSANPVNVSDGFPYSFVPLEADSARTRLDRILWQASAPESTRAMLWYGSGGPIAGNEARLAPSHEPKRRDFALERWGRSALDLTKTWRTPIVNRRTDFTHARRTNPDSLGGLFETALAENRGDAPPSLVGLYRKLVERVGNRPLDSVRVTVLCAPGMNFPGTDTDLSRWRDDPQMRFRTLLTPLPRLRPPIAARTHEGGYAPPSSLFLPTPKTVRSALARLADARDAAHIRTLARKAVTQARRSPRVKFMRELSATGELDTLLGRYRPDHRLLWPENDPSLANKRSLQTFERSFRRILLPLQGVWVAAQETRERPDRLVVLLRLHVRAGGEVSVDEVLGNVPPGTPRRILRTAVERGLSLPKAADDGTYDFLVVIGR